MARRTPSEPELLESCGWVETFRDELVPDMFVRVENPTSGDERARKAFVSQVTWGVLSSDPAAMTAFEDLVEAAGPGGLALAGPVFDQAAAWRGVRRRLRAA